MRWTGWRFLANAKGWSKDALDWDGAAVYELGVGGPRGGNLSVVYVGETRGEDIRMAAYASGRSHIEPFINQALRAGWTLFYRASSRPSKKAAKQTQDALLKKSFYPWNTIGQ